MDLELDKVPCFNLLYFNTDLEKAGLQLYLNKRFLHSKDYDQAESHERENYDRFSSLQHHLWANVLEYWLASYGLFECFIYNDNIDLFIKENPDTPYMVHGQSLREVGHVVIGMNGKFYHDPHPSDSFLKPSTPEDKWYYSYLDKVGDYSVDKYNFVKDL